MVVEAAKAPVYNICKQCLKDGNFFMVTISENREAHMQKEHGLTSEALQEMIMKPRNYFLSWQQVVEILQNTLEESETSEP